MPGKRKETERMAKMISIAIDGPSGAGKSTISKAVSNELGFIYVDTGALYRTVGLNAVNKGVNLDNREEIISSLENLKIDLTYVDGVQQVLLAGEPVGERIRTPEISMAASKVSSIPEVRSFLFDTQMKIASQHNIIMDGRDIGTVVLPNATVKIYLTASAEDRAERRYLENKSKGIECDYDSILADMKQRDYNDMHREISPLKKADDAILVQTTGNTLNKSIRVLSETIREELRKKNYEY